MMHGDQKGREPLLQAIQDFRRELLEWIDARIGMLKEGECDPGEGSPGGSLEDAPPGESRLVTELAGESALRTGWGGGEADGCFPTQFGSPGEPERREPQGDPRKRLDALARLLDERLRIAEGARGGSSANGSPVLSERDPEAAG